MDPASTGRSLTFRSFLIFVPANRGLGFGFDERRSNIWGVEKPDGHRVARHIGELSRMRVLPILAGSSPPSRGDGSGEFSVRFFPEAAAGTGVESARRQNLKPTRE